MAAKFRRRLTQVKTLNFAEFHLIFQVLHASIRVDKPDVHLMLLRTFELDGLEIGLGTMYSD